MLLAAGVAGFAHLQTWPTGHMSQYSRSLSVAWLWFGRSSYAICPGAAPQRGHVCLSLGMSDKRPPVVSVVDMRVPLCVLSAPPRVVLRCVAAGSHRSISGSPASLSGASLWRARSRVRPRDEATRRWNPREARSAESLRWTGRRATPRAPQARGVAFHDLEFTDDVTHATEERARRGVAPIGKTVVHPQATLVGRDDACAAQIGEVP